MRQICLRIFWPYLKILSSEIHKKSSLHITDFFLNCARCSIYFRKKNLDIDNSLFYGKKFQTFLTIYPRNTVFVKDTPVNCIQA